MSFEMDASASVNLAVAPTLALGLLMAGARVGKTLRLHVVGATLDAEARVPWKRLPDLLEAAGVGRPKRVDVHLGRPPAVERCRVLTDPGVVQASRSEARLQ